MDIVEITITLSHGYKEEWLNEAIKGIHGFFYCKKNNYDGNPYFGNGITGLSHCTCLQKKENGEFITDDNQFSYSIKLTEKEDFYKKIHERIQNDIEARKQKRLSNEV